MAMPKTPVAAIRHCFPAGVQRDALLVLAERLEALEPKPDLPVSVKQAELKKTGKDETKASDKTT